VGRYGKWDSRVGGRIIKLRKWDSRGRSNVSASTIMSILRAIIVYNSTYLSGLVTDDFLHSRDLGPPLGILMRFSVCYYRMRDRMIRQRFFSSDAWNGFAVSGRKRSVDWLILVFLY
jgi:hypothetical protein